MDRWKIRHSPNAEDPQRHLLLLRGGVADVAAVLKKFGALCGRPSSLDGGEFNLSFVLHNVTPPLREKLDEWLGKMSPKPAPEALPPMPSLAPPAPLIDSPQANQLGIPSAASLPPLPDFLPPNPLTMDINCINMKMKKTIDAYNINK